MGVILIETKTATEAGDPGKREKWVEQFAVEKMREYDGTVFLYTAPSDEERRRTFCRAAQALHCSAQDSREVCAAYPAADLAKRPGRNVLFVEHAMLNYLDEYLAACPAGARHLLLFSGRGDKLKVSAVFMDFWDERGVDIWDFGNE